MVAALAGAFCWSRLHADPGPLEVSLWYWHTPFRLTPKDRSALRDLGATELFVRAGTFYRRGPDVRLELPQQWDTAADGLPIHLVFNFDYSVVRAFDATPPGALARTVAAAVAAERARAERAGLRVTGVQLDLDSPTRLLPRYARLLHLLQPTARARGGRLSITALPTWFGSGEIGRVMDEVDFTVPQYYEAQIPKRLDRFCGVASMGLLRAGLRAAGRQGRPFYAGLPAYGHALVYDREGALLGTFHDMGVTEAARSALFRPVRACPLDDQGRPATQATYAGEDLYEYAALVPTRSGEPGCRVVYDLPSPVLVARELAYLRAHRPANCRGVLLFRFPEGDEQQTLPLAALRGAVRGEPLAPRLDVRLEVSSVPWELIETGRKAQRPPLDVTAVVTNVGAAGPMVGPRAVSLTLRADRAGFEDVRRGGADQAVTLSGAPGAPLDGAAPASVERANVVRLTRLSLAPGETVRFGPVRLPPDGATRMDGEWRVGGAGGFGVVTGRINLTRLQAAASP